VLSLTFGRSEEVCCQKVLFESDCSHGESDALAER
jgi:hypothetical protein